MFRLPALFDVAFLALAAYSLAAISILLRPEPARNPQDGQQVPERNNLVRAATLSYPVKFSVN
jgi:hypothetical protein